MKRWPDNGAPASFEALVEPLAKWLRAYVNNGRVETYDGFPLGEREAGGALQPVDALTFESLKYNFDNHGRDAFDAVIGAAIQLGLEQGRRLR